MLTNTYLCLHHAEVGLSSVYLWVCLINVGDTRSLVTTYATYGTLSLRIDYQPPSQKPRFARCLQKGNLSKIKHMFSYSTSTVRQILPVILAGHRQILPVQALECTYLLGLQAGMETAIYIAMLK